MNRIDLHFDRIKKLTVILDSKFNFLGFKFGIDPILSLVPGIGSFLGSLTSLYIFWLSLQMDLPKRVYLHLLANTILDYVLGSVPIAGVVFDAFYKSNQRNFKILEKYYHNLINEA